MLINPKFGADINVLSKRGGKMDDELYYIPGIGSFHPNLLGITKEDMEQQKVFDQVPSLDWLEEAVKEKMRRDADK